MCRFGSALRHITRCLVVIALLAFRTWAGVPVSFAPAVPYGTGFGTGPRAVAVADFNGDHLLDLAVANNGTGTVTILPGTGNGTFGAAAATLTADSGPVAIVAGDLTNDGHTDLVVANMSAGNLAVFVSTGSGFGFAPAVFVPLSGAAPAPSALVLGKFNADDFFDVAVANFGANRIDVLVGNGDGTFAPGDTLIFQPHPLAITTADLDQDGALDLVLATGDGTAAIFLAGDDGDLFHGFGAPGAVDQPTGIATGDVNGDNTPDLILTGAASDRIVVLSGNGDGTFNRPVRHTVGNAPQALAVADANQDGTPDVVTVNLGDDTVSVLRGTGTGSFEAAQSFSVGHMPHGLAVVDVNGDNYPDIVTANHADDGVSVLLNLTGVVTPPPTPTAIPGPEIAVGSATANAGQTAAIAVRLHANGAAVVGVQNDIGFDPSRLAITPAKCLVNQAIGKELSVSVMLKDATHALLRAIVLSFGDVEAIPDGVMYTCTFTVLAGTPVGMYPLEARTAVLSDAQGDAIAGASATDGFIMVTSSSLTPTGTLNSPTRTSSPTPTRSPSPTTTATVSATPVQSPNSTPTISPTGSLTPTPVATDTPSLFATPTETLTATESPTPVRTPCAGDCDASGGVSVDELVLGVNISLGNADVAQCRAADVDESGRVSVDELVQAVNNSLNGCPL